MANDGRNSNEKTQNTEKVLNNYFDYELNDRITILSISPGIRMNFEIGANRTAGDHPTEPERPAAELYAKLLVAVNNPESDFRHDLDFVRFSSVAQLALLDFSESDHQQEMSNKAFENLRKSYNDENACRLFTDTSHGVSKCVDSFGVRRFGVDSFGVAMLALAFFLWG